MNVIRHLKKHLICNAVGVKNLFMTSLMMTRCATKLREDYCKRTAHISQFLVYLIAFDSKIAGFICVSLVLLIFLLHLYALL